MKKKAPVARTKQKAPSAAPPIHEKFKSKPIKFRHFR